MKTGVAVTWGGFEFPNTVLLQPVNSLVIAALQEEKKNLLSAEIQMATEMKNMIKPSTFISETHLVLLKCSLMTFQGYALTPQWFEFLFLADSQLANK